MPNPRPAAEWAQDALFEWLMTDPYPTKPGIEKPSEHETRQRIMMTEIFAKKMDACAHQQVEAFREQVAQLLDKRIQALRKYRLARNTYVPAICRELELDAAAIRALR